MLSALDHKYKLAEHIFTVRDEKRREIQTKYRLSNHSLAIGNRKMLETCITGEIENEMCS